MLQAEAEKQRIQRAINEIGDDFSKLKELSEQLTAVENSLIEIEERWLELQV